MRPRTLAAMSAALLATLLLFALHRDPAVEPSLTEPERLPPLQAIDPELGAFAGDLAAIRERGVLRALVTPSRTDFFIDDGRIRGLQAEFLYRFVDRLNRDADDASRVRLKFVPVPFGELIPALEAGRGDLIAAFMTRTPERAGRVVIADAFRLSANEVVVSHAGTAAPESLEDLAGRTMVALTGSSYAEHLQALSEHLQQQGLEPIALHTADGRLYRDDLLELVNAGAIELTVVDDYAARLWSRVLPDIEVHEYLAITQDNTLGWGLRPGQEALHAEIEAFARQVRQGSLLGNILFQRYLETERFVDNPLDAEERDRLEELLPLFARYGERYDIDPLALAAQAYQESGLDHEARSHRGAVGIMQLLPSTARDPRVAIDDIHRLESNIHAGARYLAFLRDHYFDDPDMSAWDRRAFAWAAYNAGPRNIMRVRQRAERMGLDPDVWSGQTEIVASRMIGDEPVQYVANIQKYLLAYRLARAEGLMREQRVRDAVQHAL